MRPGYGQCRHGSCSCHGSALPRRRRERFGDGVHPHADRHAGNVAGLERGDGRPAQQNALIFGVLVVVFIFFSMAAAREGRYTRGSACSC
jgi:hypothetical protein